MGDRRGDGGRPAARCHPRRRNSELVTDGASGFLVPLEPPKRDRAARHPAALKIPPCAPEWVPPGDKPPNRNSTWSAIWMR